MPCTRCFDDLRADDRDVRAGGFSDERAVRVEAVSDVRDVRDGMLLAERDDVLLDGCDDLDDVWEAARVDVRVGTRPFERADAYDVERDDACDADDGVELEPPAERDDVCELEVERCCAFPVRFAPVPRVARNRLSPFSGIYFTRAFRASMSSPPTTVTSPAPMVMTMSPGSTRSTRCGTTSMRRGT